VRLAEGYSLDLVVERRGERIGFEFDGPSHFVGREPTGTTLLKRRQLRHLGWRLVSVPYWEWDLAEGSGRGAEYLSSLLGALWPGEPPAARPQPGTPAARPQPGTPAALDGAALMGLLHSDLKARCAAQGLKVSGSKAALVERLLEPTARLD
jgi:hypothetical protein